MVRTLPARTRIGTSGATRMLKEAGMASPAPIDDFLIDLHERVSGVVGGKVADYIPQLGKADPATFGIALATVNGEIYATGDADHLFTIQSISKPFMYGYALQHYGREYVLRHVGVEPTGEAFNSIVLDEVANRPFNPMVNAGAIAVAALMPGGTAEERIGTMLNLFSDLAGRRLEIDEQVFVDQVAPARTFGFLKEVEMLRQRGLALGGSLENAVVLGETGVLNPLRFEDEFVRHKILDVIGDLALVGHAIQGHLVVHRGGHALHAAFAEEILRQTDAWQLVEAPVDVVASRVPARVAARQHAAY